MKSPLKAFRNFGIMIGVMIGLGCSTVTAPLPETTVKDFVNAHAEKFAALDEATQIAIQCTRLRERRLPDGRLEVAANLQNHATIPLTLKVSCVFKDAAGVAVGDEAPFQTITVAAGAIETLRFTAATPAGNVFTVRVKRSR
jgi:hypothetical protein